MHVTELITNHEFLSTQMYGTDQGLAVRQRTHKHYTQPQLPQGLEWEALIEQVARQIEAQVAQQGEYRV
jgi:hypothetical protein